MLLTLYVAHCECLTNPSVLPTQTALIGVLMPQTAAGAYDAETAARAHGHHAQTMSRMVPVGSWLEFSIHSLYTPQFDTYEN